jgi:hypothetical protein
MLQRAPSLPQHPYYVTEQSNPGVATMNTNPLPPHPSAPSMPSQYHQMQPRQGIERLPLDIPYTTATGLSANIQSSPSSFSAASTRSPDLQNGFYTHAPAAQAATYALHTASPVEQQQQQHQHHLHLHQQQVQQTHQPQHQQLQPQQQHPQQPQLVAYPGQIPSQHQVMAQPSPLPPPREQQQQQQQQQVIESPPQPQHDQLHPVQQYHPPQAQPVVEEQGWYAPYQPPVVTTIHQIPTYGSTLYESWGLKSDYDDPSIQMPSARIESM